MGALLDVSRPRPRTEHQARVLRDVQRMTRELLEHPDWSYRTIAEACEVAHGAVQGWEAGESIPNASAYMLLKALHARVLGSP